MILLLLRRELAAGSDEEAEGGAAEIFDGAGKNGSVHRADGIAQAAACGVGKVGTDALLGKRLRADIRILPIAQMKRDAAGRQHGEGRLADADGGIERIARKP